MNPEIPTDNSTNTALVTKLINVLNNCCELHDKIINVVICETPELKDEHRATDTVYGKVIFKDSTLKPRNIFIKKFPENYYHAQVVRKMKLMEKEASFFNEFLPSALKFCNNYIEIGNFLNFFPKHLYADNEIIVLDNLVLNDSYVMLPKADKQDFDTAKLVLDHLAKFHAVTYAMIKEYGTDEFCQKWEINVAETYDIEKNPNVKNMFDKYIGICLSILENYDLDGIQEAVTYLKSLIGHLWPEIENLLRTNRKSNGLVVLNHGDCWNNNMLFKVDSVTGNVVEHIFIDFQVTRYGSPGLDLGYFFYTSVKPETRKAHLKELLMHYYQQFRKTIEIFGKTLEPNFEEFLEDYKRNSRFGFALSLCILVMIDACEEINMSSSGAETSIHSGADPETRRKLYNIAIKEWIGNNLDKTEPLARQIIDLIHEETYLVELQ